MSQLSECTYVPVTFGTTMVHMYVAIPAVDLAIEAVL
jgi:hypothetical protein